MFWIISLILIVLVIVVVSIFSKYEYEIGKVEIVEVDGKYAVRQYGFRSKNDYHNITYKTYAERFGTHWIDIKPEWYWFNEKGEKQYRPVEMTLVKAKKVANKLRKQYEDFIEKEKERESREDKEKKRIKAFENGKVVK